MYGEGLENLEKTTNETLDELFRQIDEKIGKPWTVNEDLVTCFLNIILSLVGSFVNFYFNFLVDFINLLRKIL